MKKEEYPIIMYVEEWKELKVGDKFGIFPNEPTMIVKKIEKERIYADWINKEWEREQE